MTKKSIKRNWILRKDIVGEKSHDQSIRYGHDFYVYAIAVISKTLRICGG